MKNKMRISTIVMIIVGALIVIFSGIGIAMLTKSMDGFKKKTETVETTAAAEPTPASKNVKATYSIHFDANGGQGKMDDQIADLGSAVMLRKNSFSRVECSFAGWNTKADGSGISYSNSANVKDIATAGGKTTLYAQWKTNTYTVHFDANGGQGKMDDQIINRGAQQKLTANAFTLKEYVFTGWNTKADGKGIEYKDQTAIKDITAAGTQVTLYAQWKIQTYMISFDANGGTGTMESRKVDRGASISLPANAFTRNDYVFTGWNTKADGTGSAFSDRAGVKDIAEKNENLTLYAQWKIQTYTIRFNGNGGTGAMADQIINRGAGVDLAANTFTREHSEFAGWNTKPDGTGTAYSAGENVKDLTAANSIITLYAQWKNLSYTITYDANGGSGSMTDQVVSQGTSVNVAANKFTRENYDFTGWNTSADGSGTSYSAGESVKDLEGSGKTVTLYAQWKAQTYTIRFEANGGMGVMDDQTVGRGDTATLAPNEFTREFYKFKGWNTKPDGSGENYSSEEEIRDLAGAGQTVTLYAQWIIQLQEQAQEPVVVLVPEQES